MSLAKVDGGKSVALITVGGEVWFFDKANYSFAEAAGVQGCWNGFFVNKVHTPTVALG